MTKKPSEEKFVTEVVFKQEMKSIHQEVDGLHQKIDDSIARADKKIDDSTASLDKKIDDSITRLDKKIDNIAYELVKTNGRLEKVENTMATKSDINLVLDKIDHVLKKISVFDQEESVQSLHLKEVRHQVEDHEKRLVTLESSR